MIRKPDLRGRAEEIINTVNIPATGHPAMVRSISLAVQHILSVVDEAFDDLVQQFNEELEKVKQNEPQ